MGWIFNFKYCMWWVVLYVRLDIVCDIRNKMGNQEFFNTSFCFLGGNQDVRFQYKEWPKGTLTHRASKRAGLYSGEAII